MRLMRPRDCCERGEVDQQQVRADGPCVAVARVEAVSPTGITVHWVPYIEITIKRASASSDSVGGFCGFASRSIFIECDR